MSRLCAPWNELPRWRELDVLTEAYSENTLDAEQAARLETLLLEDREAKRRFLGYLYLDGAMRWDGAVGVAERLPSELAELETQGKLAVVLSANERLSSTPKSSMENSSHGARARQWVGRLAWQVASYYPARFWATVTALTIIFLTPLVLLVGSRWPREQVSQPASESLPPIVAHITGQHECQWAKDSWRPQYSGHLRQGRELNLAAGLLEITYDSGTRLILEGPAKFCIDDKNAGALNVGKLTARVPKWAIGFVVKTSRATITDLGTEFGVAVDESGNVDVDVFKGIVEVASATESEENSPRKKVVLQTGQTVRLTDGQQIEVVASDAQRPFARRLPVVAAPMLNSAQVIVDLEPEYAVYQGRAITSGAGNLTLEEISIEDGLAFNITFTPTDADLTGTTLLMEIGGEQRAAGLYLVDGVPTFTVVWNGPFTITHTVSLDDTTFGDNRRIAVAHGDGALKPGVLTTVAVVFDPAKQNLQFGVGKGALDTWKISDASTETDWVGNASFSVGVLSSNLGHHGALNRIAKDRFNHQAKSLEGNVSGAVFWNHVGRIIKDQCQPNVRQPKERAVLDE